MLLDFEPPASQLSGDSIAELLTAWHVVAQTIAMSRCKLNEKTGVHKGSITNLPKFIQNNTAYVALLFKDTTLFPDEGGGELPEHQWFFLPHVKKVIEILFTEACNQKHGKFKWENFWLDAWEFHMYTEVVVRSYAAGSEPWTD